jgi:CHAT domain-containing protein/tetratricopeptide (TPR) repeat protein
MDKLKELDELQASSRTLRAEGRMTEAIAATEKALVIQREILGKASGKVVESLEFLAEMHEAVEDFGAARKEREEVLAIRTESLGAQHWLVTDARLAVEHVELLARIEPQERGLLQEAASLNTQIVQLWRAGKFREALPLARKAVGIRRKLLGERHPDFALSVLNLGAQHEALGQSQEAEPLYLQAREIFKHALGERHPDYALSLSKLAKVYEAQGKYAQAEPLCRHALEIRKEVLGERHPDYALSLNDLAVLYQAEGDYARAEPLLLQAMDIAKQALGERHPEYAVSVNNLAELYRALGLYGKAEPLYRQALDIRKQALGERHPHYALSLDTLASLCQDQGGEYAKAELLFRQALDIRKQALGECHPDYATSLNNLALLYQIQGEYAKAEPPYRQARDIRKQVQGEGHPNYATSLNNLAMVYYAQGEYAKAEALCRKAADIQKQALGPCHPGYAGTLNNLAALYQDQGDYPKAESLFRQALAIRKQALSERHPHYAQSLGNLANLYQLQGEYAKAEPLFRQTLEIRKQALGERHPLYAASLLTLACLYQAQGEYAKAEPLFRQALDILKQALGERHPYYALSMNKLGALCQAQGEYAKAELLFRQAIAALRQPPEGPLLEFAQLSAGDLRPLPATVSCLQNYCVFLVERPSPQPTALQLRSADHAFALALSLRERLRQEVLEQDASKLQHGAEAMDLIPRRIGLYRRLLEQEGRAADLETLLFTAELGTARVFLEQLGKARALTVGGVSAELRAEEAAYSRQLRELDARLAKEQDKLSNLRDPDKVRHLLEEQKKVEALLNELVRRMEKEYPQYAALKHPRPCSLADARACLAANEVALLFVPGDKQSYLLLVEALPAGENQASGLLIFALPGQNELSDGISRLTARDTFESQVRARAVGKQGYQLLLAPVKERIRGKDLVIVPGGPLAHVPFEALVEDGHFLIEKHRIRYAPSLTALHLVRLWEKTRAKPERALWGMADPVYDKGDKRTEGKADLAQASKDALAEYLSRTDRGPAAGEAYPRLRFTGQEVEAIRVRLGAADADVLTGLRASEAAVKAASDKGLLARARYVHFAAHGILGLDTGQPPALVLSLVGNDGQRDEAGGVNDGFLRLDEVTRLRLNADLVVLSACETGKGKPYAGEGVTGLARAFLYAGSRGVVCSLWAVDDRETATFMADLYGGLKDGKNAADALRAAKLGMIRAGKPPVFWAPFILIGE